MKNAVPGSSGGGLQHPRAIAALEDVAFGHDAANLAGVIDDGQSADPMFEHQSDDAADIVARCAGDGAGLMICCASTLGSLCCRAPSV
ncbi:hypothetical protein J2Z17_000806 [Rhizobium halophytocola]|uniref:Uncharacterized protein n=1 Tax=Rhizobium halophytocola TaxID=735519 RepID=A0ABS4DUM4_9HYPH|nr:hypothetical protein [Rhizobium halophytocola]